MLFLFYHTIQHKLCLALISDGTYHDSYFFYLDVTTITSMHASYLILFTAFSLLRSHKRKQKNSNSINPPTLFQYPPTGYRSSSTFNISTQNHIQSRTEIQPRKFYVREIWKENY